MKKMNLKSLSVNSFITSSIIANLKTLNGGNFKSLDTCKDGGPDTSPDQCKTTYTGTISAGEGQS